MPPQITEAKSEEELPKLPIVYCVYILPPDMAFCEESFDGWKCLDITTTGWCRCSPLPTTKEWGEGTAKSSRYDQKAPLFPLVPRGDRELSRSTTLLPSRGARGGLA